MISDLDWIIFRPKYLNAAQFCDPIVKARSIRLISLFKKRNSSTCVHNYPFTFD